MNEMTIEQIIDFNLQKWIDVGLNKRPDEIDPEMAGIKGKEGWTECFPSIAK
jgi:hypothetical protein